MYMGLKLTLHITDQQADAAARKLAAMRSLSISEAVKVACLEAIEADSRKIPLAQRISDIQARIKAAPATGLKADKAFFDAEYGE